MFEHNHTGPQLFSLLSDLCSSFFSHSLCKFHFYRTLPSGCFPLGIWQFENVCLKNMMPRTESNISAEPTAESSGTVTFLALGSINVRYTYINHIFYTGLSYIHAWPCLIT